MSERYEYEGPGFIKQIAIRWTDHLKNTKTPLAKILDKQTGERIGLDDDECEVLFALSGTLGSFDNLPAATYSRLVDRTFDVVVTSFVARRSGQSDVYDAIVGWDPDDWLSWCASELSALNTSKDQ